MMRFNFDRYQNNKLMAEGVSVHAETLEDAIRKAEDIASRAYKPGWRLQFTDNKPCPLFFKRADYPHRCNVCYPLT